MNKLNVYISSSLDGDLEKVISYANSLNTNLEISRFGDITTLDNNFDETLKYFSKKLNSFEQNLSLHGFFLDLNPATPDPEIKKITTYRYNQAFTIAKTVKADTIVFHSGYNGLVKHPVYEKLFLEGQINFWQEFIKQFEDEGITAVIENTYESTPDTIIKIVDNVNSNNLKMCIDTGHVNINSDLSVTEWIERVGNRLKHLHMHNNSGKADEHNSFLKGTVNFEEVINKLSQTGLDLNLVIEIFNYDSSLESLKLIEKILNKGREYGCVN